MVKATAATSLLVSGLAMAQDAPTIFQCEGGVQQGSSKTQTQIEPFSIEIQNKAVNLSGVGSLETRFSLIQKDEKFYVFKNARKDQGGNIDRQSGRVNLYAIDKTAHKLTVSIDGLCH
jgi:hypothetical protein